MNKNKISILTLAQMLVILAIVPIIYTNTTNQSSSWSYVTISNNALKDEPKLKMSTSGWTTTEVISTESLHAVGGKDVSIAVDGAGNVHVVWEDYTNIGGAGTDLDIFYKFWNANSGIWSGRVNATDIVSTESTGPSDSPSIAVDSSGNVHVVWFDNTNYTSAGTDFDIFYKVWNATTSTWKTTTVVSTESTGSAYGPKIVADGFGNVHVVWYDDANYGGSGTDYDIFYKFWNATTNLWNGTITATDVVSTESLNNSILPSLAVDGSGNVHVVWHDQTNYTGVGTDYDIFYKFWNATSSTWSTTSVVSTESTLDSSQPSIAVDLLGNIHVVWNDFTDYGGAGAGENDIFYKFWNASTGIWNGTINATDVVSTESTSLSYEPSIAVDGSGSVHVAWYDWSPYDGAGPYFDIFYKFWDPISGNWNGYVNATDVISTESTNHSYSPSIAVDGSGKVHVAWDEYSDYGGSGVGNDIFYKYFQPRTVSPSNRLELLILIMGAQEPDTIIIFVIIGIGAAVATIIFILIVKKSE